MSTAPVTASASATQIAIEPKKEVRFAVVMYGGVSLAIYINGVTQELFRMVRSTAAAGVNGNQRTALSGALGTSPTNSLRGTERVYRKISHLLSDEDLLNRLRTQAAEVEKEKDKDKAKAEKAAAALTEELEKLATNDAAIFTTFVVDILSGTSAGGINAIYLAKALANEQRIDRLKELWISEGDIELLLNDEGSLRGVDLQAQNPPVSLLNSRRMYLKLLRALDHMDEDNPRDKTAASPYSKELDLYITATDIEGVRVPLRLADRIVFERRHRNVFHFEYQEAGVNDFLDEKNPFLAFAARCTSSFPFAFEPMRLTDIDEVLNLLPEYRDRAECKSNSEKWKRYFKETVDPDPETRVSNLRLEQRSFSDGGALDNKPFSYAIEALVRRQSDVPVDRRLIYVEPSPEHPEDVPEREQKPDALQNVKNALLDLPTYETIREDLQRVLERNLLIDRMRRITSRIERDMNQMLTGQLGDRLREFRVSLSQTPAAVIPERDLYDQQTITDTVKQKERSFLSYRKLRISAVTDDIARLLARLLDFDANSDLLLAMRCLVRAWLESNYSDNREPTLKQFLLEFDMGYRIRRLNSIRDRIDRLCDYDWIVEEELKKFSKKLSAFDETFELDPEQLRRFRHENADIGWCLGLLSSSNILFNLNAEQRQELRDDLIYLKCEVNNVYKDMQQALRKLRLRRSSQVDDGSPVNPLLESFEKIGLKTEHLRAIINPENLQNAVNGRRISNIGAPNEDDCLLVARQFLFEHSTDRNFIRRLGKAAKKLKEELSKPTDLARKRIEKLLNPKKEFEPESDRGTKYMQGKDRTEWKNKAHVKAAREYLAYYYYNFEEYDQISFPVFYEADVGEASIVEIIRISPEDATELIDERQERRNSPDGTGRRKLAGLALHHFGAFLDRTWRQNDIMWGRLDGFERIIGALLPGKQNEALRRVLIKEGHTSILIDELPPESRLQLGGLVSEALVRASAGEPIDTAVARVTGELNASPVRTRLEAVIRASLENQELLDFIKTGYEVNRKLDPKPLLLSISRSTQIIGKVFESIANNNQLDGSSLKWIARLGQLFWGFVEVAVPNSLRNMLWNHWLKVVYAFEVFTILAGVLVSSTGAQQFGWTAFGITIVINVIVLVLKDIMRGRRAVLRATGVIACILILFLAVLGFLELLGPVFGVYWGPTGQAVYPMTWIKETIKGVVPFRNVLASRSFDLTVLGSVTGLVILVSGFFGLVDFSWLDLRWRLCRAWWKQCRFRSYLPGTQFKPISIFAIDLDKRTKVFPGKQDQFILPFSFSKLPPNGWIKHFEMSFKQQNPVTAAQQITTSNKEILVVSTTAQLGTLFTRLSDCAKTANEKYQSELSDKAKKDFRRQKDLLEVKSRSLVLAPTTFAANVSAQLEAISQAAMPKMNRWTRISALILGLLTIALSVALVYDLAMSFNRYRSAHFPGELHKPGLALQFARNSDEAQTIIETEGRYQSNGVTAGKMSLRQNIKVDWFVIADYVIALGLLYLWITIQSPAGRRSFSAAAAVSVLAAGLFDVLENTRILALLNESPITADAVNRVAFAASMKWGSFFLMLLFIGRKFWAMNWLPFKGLGLYLTLAALVGAVGLLGVRSVVELAFWLMAIGLLLVGTFILLVPRRFRD